jgi:hypothetical protein
VNSTIATDIESTRILGRQGAAWAGIAGPTAFVAVFLALEVVQRREYDPVAETVSALEAGSHGWVQQLSFVLLGGLTLVFAAGLHRTIAPARGGFAGPLLIAASGVAAILAALFPVRLDAGGTTYSPVGHIVAGTMFFATSAVALILLSRRLAKDPRWTSLATYTAAAGVAAVVGFVLMGAVVMPDGAPLHEYAGLCQRALVVLVVFPCRVVLAVRMLRLSGRAQPVLSA